MHLSCRELNAPQGLVESQVRNERWFKNLLRVHHTQDTHSLQMRRQFRELRNFSQITQPINGKLGIQIPVSWLSVALAFLLLTYHRACKL